MTIGEPISEDRVLATLIRNAQPTDLPHQIFAPMDYAIAILDIRDSERRGIEHVVLTPLSQFDPQLPFDFLSTYE